MGWNAICVSLHKRYSDYADFAKTLDGDLSDVLTGSESFLIDQQAGAKVKSFQLKCLADLSKFVNWLRKRISICGSVGATTRNY